ncbi:DNA repair protein RadC [Glaciecola sp. KUL10]|uniref:RadC family protein n=1 Tax=Glaciecola sp. (strain KUL10) TaxID=2161813 RepID=UPI000D78515F|nr:DNA repair protein RadC [Glaciecola sp. KUL10]
MNDKQSHLTAQIRQSNEHQVLEQAAEILSKRHFGGDAFTSAEDTVQFLSIKLGNEQREVFAVMCLDSQHRLIEYRNMFFGTVNCAAVYPREIVKTIIETNAAAIIISHNHPSGVPEPSQADIQITERIKNAISLIDVPLLDHIIVGETCVSMAQRGLI